MTVAETIKMTAKQYLQLGEDPPGVRLELVNGEIRVSPSPTNAHAFALSQLLRTLGNYAEKHRLGVVMSDTDHVVTEYTVRRPDLYFFTTPRLKLLDLEAIEHAPDLAVEIISESSGRIDREEKFEEYANFGIPHYWLIDPQMQSAEAFALKHGKYIAAGSGKGLATIHLPPFEELAINLGNLWWPPRISSK